VWHYSVVYDESMAAGYDRGRWLRTQDIGTWMAVADELIERVRSRSLSNLAALPDTLFRQGLRVLERDARLNSIPQRIVEELDLVVFRSGPLRPMVGSIPGGQVYVY
jgi:hypothetical protein